MARRRTPAKIPAGRPVVWVTGASRGIGEAIARQFGMIGCTVCLSGRRKEALVRVARDITSRGGIAHVYPCDLSQAISVVPVAARIARDHGPVDVLVCNAGVTVFKPFLGTTLEEFDEIIDTNLRGHIYAIKAVLPAMVKRRSGWIFNIGSNAAVKTFAGSAAYSATKGGLLALMKVLREELKEYHVKVVSVLPGAVETGMWSRASRKKYSSRMMRPESVGEAVLSLYLMPDDVVTDQIILRPIQGDIE